MPLFNSDEFREVVAGETTRTIYHAERMTLNDVEPIAREWLRNEIAERGHCIYMRFVHHLSTLRPKTDANLAHKALRTAAEDVFAINFKMSNYVYTADANDFLKEHCTVPGYLSLSARGGISYFMNDEVAAMMFKMLFHKPR